MFDAPASAAAVDLDAYFGRIGYDGPREPTLAVLRAIAFRHPDAIPFENLDVLLGRGVSIVPADIDAKLIAGGRGGYCYEQNGLLKRVLEALGFQVEGLMARVKWMSPDDATQALQSKMPADRRSCNGPCHASVSATVAQDPSAPSWRCTAENVPSCRTSLRGQPA